MFPATVAHQDHTSSCDTHQGGTLELGQTAWAAAADCTARFQDTISVTQKAHAGFGWGRINFLPNGWYGAVRLGFVLNAVIRGIFIIAEQDLHRTKAFSTSCTATLSKTLGICGKLRGDTARRGDSNRPKIYSGPYTQGI